MNICKALVKFYLCIHNYTYGYSSAKISSG